MAKRWPKANTGRGCSRGLPHLGNVPERRRAEDPAIFAAELRRAFVADPAAGRGGHCRLYRRRPFLKASEENAPGVRRTSRADIACFSGNIGRPDTDRFATGQVAHSGEAGRSRRRRHAGRPCPNCRFSPASVVALVHRCKAAAGIVAGFRQCHR